MTTPDKTKMPTIAEEAMGNVPSSVKREVRSFWRKHGPLAVKLGIDNVLSYVSRMANGETGKVRTEMYGALSDAERIAFDRSVTREIINAGNKRLQEVAFVAEVERDLRGLALNAFSTALGALALNAPEEVQPAPGTQSTPEEF